MRHYIFIFFVCALIVISSVRCYAKFHYIFQDSQTQSNSASDDSVNDDDTPYELNLNYYSNESPIDLFEKDGLYGYKNNKTGEIIISPQYKDAREFHEGRAAVSKDGRYWKYIDEQGKVIIDCNYGISKMKEAITGMPNYGAGDFHEGLALVQKGTDFQFIDRNGLMPFKLPKQSVIVMRFNETHFSDSVVWILMYDKQSDRAYYSLYNLQGTEIARLEKHYDIIKLDGDSITRYLTIRDPKTFENGYALVDGVVVKPGKGIKVTCVVDKKCNILAVCAYSDDYTDLKILHYTTKDTSVAKLILASALWNYHRKQMAYQLFIESANEGNSRAQFIMGWLYEHDDFDLKFGKDIYLKEAKKWHCFIKGKDLENQLTIIDTKLLKEQKDDSVKDNVDVITEEPISTNNLPKNNIGKRIALVIGNSLYEHEVQLQNAAKDSKAVWKKLVELGFEEKETICRNNVPDIDSMKVLLENFYESGKNAEVALLYYAGHGEQYDGESYLIPTNYSGHNIRQNCTNVPNILRELSQTGAKKIIVILDACRTIVRGSNHIDISSNCVARGTCLIYSTQSRDGAIEKIGNGEHSPFTQELLNGLSVSKKFSEFLNDLRDSVYYITKEAQMPVYINNIPPSKKGEEFYLNTGK